LCTVFLNISKYLLASILAAFKFSGVAVPSTSTSASEILPRGSAGVGIGVVLRDDADETK
jgi:hypothetical protein